MQMHTVSSSNINAVGYDPALKEMRIEFHNGGVYRYFDVEQDIFDGLLNAASVGSYFHAHVKGAYAYEQVH